MATITITSGPDNGRTLPLEDSQTIGRIARCAIQIRDTRASREHVRLYRQQDRFFLVDLDSKNGIFFQGELVRKAELSPGDEFQVGETWLRIDYDPREFTVPSRPPERTQHPGGADEVQVRRGGGISAEPIRTGGQRLAGRTQDHHQTRTSLAWMRTDLSQVSGLYRTLLIVGGVLIAISLGVFAYFAAL